MSVQRVLFGIRIDCYSVEPSSLVPQLLQNLADLGAAWPQMGQYCTLAPAEPWGC